MQSARPCDCGSKQNFHYASWLERFCDNRRDRTWQIRLLRRFHAERSFRVTRISLAREKADRLVSNQSTFKISDAILQRVRAAPDARHAHGRLSSCAPRAARNTESFARGPVGIAKKRA